MPRERGEKTPHLQGRPGAERSRLHSQCDTADAPFLLRHGYVERFLRHQQPQRRRRVLDPARGVGAGTGAGFVGRRRRRRTLARIIVRRHVFIRRQKVAVAVIIVVIVRALGCRRLPRPALPLGDELVALHLPRDTALDHLDLLKDKTVPHIRA